jgi:hypothetical protein
MNALIVDPRADPFEAIHNLTKRELERSVADLPKEVTASLSDELRPSICEIGMFLMNRLAPYPTSFEACRAICDKFRHYDLYKVMTSLQEAVKAEDCSVIQSKSRDLSELFDKVWNDSNRPQTYANVVRGGVIMGVAVLGGVAAGPIGAVGGLLAGLGYNVVEKIIESKTDSVSEKIARQLVPNYLVNILDFRKKYDLGT